jgi:acylphosphatase
MPTVIHRIVSGKVQGVYFRSFTHETAQRLELLGWVRNLPDGRVETVALGEDKALETFRDQLRQGPPLAEVADVACGGPVSDEVRAAAAEAKGFSILH